MSMVSNLSPIWLPLLHTLKELEWFQKLHLLFSESLPKYVLTSKYVWNENKHHAYQSAYRHLCLEVAQTLSFSFQSTHPACQHVLLSYFISILNQSISNNNIKKLQTVCPPVQTILHPHQSEDSVNIRHLVILSPLMLHLFYYFYVCSRKFLQKNWYFKVARCRRFLWQLVKVVLSLQVLHRNLILLDFVVIWHYANSSI